MNVHVLVGSPSAELLSSSSCVVATGLSVDAAVAMDTTCHAAGVPFIKADIHGVFGQVFCDFGAAFEVSDVDGENPHTGIIASIEQGPQTLICCIEDERIEFQVTMLIPRFTAAYNIDVIIYVIYMLYMCNIGAMILISCR